jgi:hypothetical protein
VTPVKFRKCILNIMEKANTIWNIGIMECWNTGIKRDVCLSKLIIPIFHYSTIPVWDSIKFLKNYNVKKFKTHRED